jgi:hypothetical protein
MIDWAYMYNILQTKNMIALLNMTRLTTPKKVMINWYEISMEKWEHIYATYLEASLTIFYK